MAKVKYDRTASLSRLQAQLIQAKENNDQKTVKLIQAVIDRLNKK